MDGKNYTIDGVELLVYNNRLWVEAGDSLETEDEPEDAAPAPAKRKYKKHGPAKVKAAKGSGEGKGHRLSPEVKALIEKELKAGKSATELAEEYECATGTIYAIRDKMKNRPEPNAGIEGAKKIKCQFCGHDFLTKLKEGKLPCPECGEENEIVC